MSAVHEHTEIPAKINVKKTGYNDLDVMIGEAHHLIAEIYQLDEDIKSISFKPAKFKSVDPFIFRKAIKQ